MDSFLACCRLDLSSPDSLARRLCNFLLRDIPVYLAVRVCVLFDLFLVRLAKIGVGAAKLLAVFLFLP